MSTTSPVILSVAKDLFASLGLAARQEILRCAQDDKERVARTAVRSTELAQ
jgi:hypothetical protein